LRRTATSKTVSNETERVFALQVFVHLGVLAAFPGPISGSLAHRDRFGFVSKVTHICLHSLGKQVLPVDTTSAGCKDSCVGEMRQKHTTVLLIDDEASQRSFMRSVLEDAEYEVLEGSDFNEALVIHRQYPGAIDVILTDVSLPGNNGYILVKALLDLRPGLSAIFMSGRTGAEVCRFYGMATTDLHFLEKPFTGDELVQRVQRISECGGPFLTRTAS
jgi:CheY-like chemotaxis protein